MRTAVKKLLFVRSAVPAWARGLDAFWDFQKGGDALADTHAQTIYAPNAAGVYMPFAANQLVRTDRGVQTQPTRTNLCFYSSEVGNSVWVAGLPSPAPVTDNQATAPDGTLTADLVSISSPNPSRRQLLSSLTSGQVCTGSIFVKKPASGGATHFWLSTNNTAAWNTGGGTKIALTDSWQRVPASITPSGTQAYLIIGGQEPVSGNYDAQCAGDVLVWGAQFEQGAFASPPILTTGAATTVNGNQPVLTGLGSQLANGVAGIIQVNLLQAASNASGVGSRLIELNDNTANNRVLIQGITDQSVSLGGSLAGTPLNSAGTATGFWSQGVQTYVFAISPNFMAFRRVGSAQSTVTTNPTIPSMDRVALLGRSIDTAGNTFGQTRKLGLKYGPQDQASFDAMYARALSA